MNKQLPNRRDFNGLCVALCSSLALVGPAGVALSSAPARAATHTVKLHDGTIVPALGQGSARLGQGKHPEPAEEEALRTGLSLGMTLIDTAEMYGNGRSEELIRRVIAGQRDRVSLVSKVSPNHVRGKGIARACDASLARLGTDYLDLYLLHWPTRDAELSSIVAAFESLRAAGKIVPGASPISTSVTWKSCSECHTAIAAEPIRSSTTLPTAASSRICCHGASGIACR